MNKESEENLAKLTEILKTATEVMLFFLIDGLGGCKWRERHEYSDERMDITKEAFEENQEYYSAAIQKCVEKLPAFGVDPESVKDKEGSYWKWYTHWKNWKEGMTQENWEIFDQKFSEEEPIEGISSKDKMERLTTGVYYSLFFIKLVFDPKIHTLSMFYLPSHHMDQPLIVFYSLEGFTQKIAQTIATITHGKLLQLSPQQDISSTQNKWKKYFRGGKQVVMKETPPLKPYICDIKSIQHYIYRDTSTSIYLYSSDQIVFATDKDAQQKNRPLLYPGMITMSHITKLKEALQDNTILASKDFNKKLLQNDPQLLQQEIQTFITHL